MLAIGLALIGFDVARLTMTGVAVLGVVLVVLLAWMRGILARDWWIEDDPSDETTGLDRLQRESQR